MITLNMKLKGNGFPILQSFSKAGSSKNVLPIPPPQQPQVNESERESSQSAPSPTATSTTEQEEGTIVPRKRKAEKQEQVATEITAYEKQLNVLYEAKNSGLDLSETQIRRLKDLQIKKRSLQFRLKRLQTQQKSSKKTRENKKKALQRLRTVHPEIAVELQSLLPKAIGRPRLEHDQPALLETILMIVSAHSDADGKRQTDTLRFVKTLDQLLAELRFLGESNSK